MTSKDVRDILSLPDNAVAGPSAAQHRRPAKKDRPEGISRELFALIGDNAPSLAQAREFAVGKQAQGSYKERLGSRKKVRWEWTPFTPANHPAKIRLGHWKRADEAAQQEEDPFEAFGRPGAGPNVMQYSQQEYEQHLTDPDWTPHETAYLFHMLQEYDLRFLVVADRYAYLPPGSKSGQQSHIYPIPSALPSTPSHAPDGVAVAANKDGLADKVSSRERRSTRSIASMAGVGGEGPAPRGRSSRGGTPNANAREAQPTESKSAIKQRSLEEIKNRYYTICRRLVRSRPAADDVLKEKLVTAYSFDLPREIARKKYAASLFHLTRPQIQEEEALYVELQKMQQKQARYASERQELMKTMNGLDSGVFYPDGVNGNKVFGNAAASGIGGARGADGVLMQGDKMRKRKRGEDGDVAGVQEPPEPQPAHVIEKQRKDDPAFDERNNIYRMPPSAVSHLAPSRSLHVPAFLRSTKLATPRPATAVKVTAMLEELGVNATRLIMPTKTNADKFEALLGAAQNLLDMKKQVDRAEQELRILRAQKELGANGQAPVESGTPASAIKRIIRSESVVSSTASDVQRKSRR